MTQSHLRFDFNLIKGLVTYLVEIPSILWSFPLIVVRSCVLIALG